MDGNIRENSREKRKDGWFKRLFRNDDKRLKILSELSNHVPGEVHWNFFGVTFKGTYKGVEFAASFWGADEGPDANPCLQVVIKKPSDFTMKAYSMRSFLIRAQVKLRLLKKVNTGDERFDAEVCAASKDPDRTMSYLAARGVREALMGLFRKGYVSFEISAKKISFIKYVCDLGDIKPKNVMWILENFCK
ncbi:MAG: hypothetical protein HQL30_02670 [Candidatus Omnitrophica bacterium]|nr:hypothetical protein [Candidatus Omnitrophota bacterium]